MPILIQERQRCAGFGAEARSYTRPMRFVVVGVLGVVLLAAAWGLVEGVVAGRRRHGRAALRAAGRLAAPRQQDQGARLLPELAARSARAADRQPLEQHRLGRQGSQLPRELGLAGGRRPQHAGDPRDPARLSRPDGDPADLPGRDDGEREDLPQEDRRASRTRAAPGARRAGSRRRCTPSTTAPTPGMSSSPGAAEARSTRSASTWRRRSRSRRSSPT